MKIVFFGNNNAAVDILQFLVESGNELVALVTHPLERQKRAGELIEISKLHKDSIFQGNELRKRGCIERISELKPDIGVSAFFGYILRRQILDIFQRGCINVHPALLPYNRGAYPNVWSIVDGTPAGVTLHMMDEGVDTGDIIDQKRVPVFAWDTGSTLYNRLESACVEMFKVAWPRFVSGELRAKPQQKGGTEHRIQDVEKIDEIHLDQDIRAGKLIDILRARSFPPYKGAYFKIGDRKVFVRLELQPEDENEGQII
jgi:methionyl-tRNA formyltransferase